MSTSAKWGIGIVVVTIVVGSVMLGAIFYAVGNTEFVRFESVEVPIVALQDNYYVSVSGSLLGGFESKFKSVATYAVELDKKIQIKSLVVGDNVYFVESADCSPSLVTIVEWRRWPIFGVVKSSKYSKRYEFHIPEGSIARDFNMNLR